MFYSSALRSFLQKSMFAAAALALVSGTVTEAAAGHRGHHGEWEHRGWDDDDGWRGHGRGHGHWRGNDHVVINMPGWGYHPHRWNRPVYYNQDVTIINRYPPRYYGAPAVIPSSGRMVQVECNGREPIFETMLGGVAGGVVGHQFGKGNGKVAATIGGAILGGLIGQDFGYHMSATDAGCTRQVFDYAEPGTQVSWRNPDSDDYYSVVPTRNFTNDGRYCREYQAVATVGGKYQQTYGTACRQPDGDWEIIN